MGAARDMPAAEVGIDEPLVRGLLRDQHPDLAGLALAPLAFGWDNVIYRLGDAHTVRLPRRAAAATLIEHEQRWLPELAPRLPLPIPVPDRCGVAGRGYPWSWSVTPWLDGAPASHTPPSDLGRAAQTLGEFLAALHRPAAPDAPENPYRGIPLAERAARVDECLVQLDDMVATTELRACWDDLVATPPWPGTPRWLHGDLHPANMLVADGKVSAIIDFGDITAGDPATDLSVAWMLLPPDARQAFRGAAGDVDDDTWARARAWALALGLAYVEGSGNNATITRIGRETLAAVLVND